MNRRLTGLLRQKENILFKEYFKFWLHPPPLPASTLLPLLTPPPLNGPDQIGNYEYGNSLIRLAGETEGGGTRRAN
jgi:hypothetical protein